jgi:hypothetical protein
MNDTNSIATWLFALLVVLAPIVSFGAYAQMLNLLKGYPSHMRTITSKQYKAKFVAMGCFLITLLYIIGLSAMKPRDAPLAFSGSVVAGTLILGVLCALGILAGVIVASRVFGPKSS